MTAAMRNITAIMHIINVNVFDTIVRSGIGGYAPSAFVDTSSLSDIVDVLTIRIAIVDPVSARNRHSAANTSNVNDASAYKMSSR